MTTLVAGATGKTGLPLVEQLLSKDHDVRVIVRSRDRLSAAVLEHPNTTVIEASQIVRSAFCIVILPFLVTS